MSLSESAYVFQQQLNPLEKLSTPLLLRLSKPRTHILFSSSLINDTFPLRIDNAHTHTTQHREEVEEEKKEGR